MHSWTSPALPDLGPSGRGIRVRDSVTGEVVPTGRDGRASLYVCGITPYDATHLGHANTYVTFDLLVRAWRDAGVEVRYTQNVTDVDDPLLERAHQLGVDWRELAAEQVDLFRGDMTALRVVAPDSYIGAVESIPDVVRAVERLLADGAAYRVPADANGEGEGDVYASLAADSRFTPVIDGDDQVLAATFAERGGDPGRPGKKDPLDPLLWRLAREGEPAWDGNDLGPGRPGWHVECATIAAATLGAPLDVVGGGVDLRFPHHPMSESHLRLLSHTPRPVLAHVHGGLVAYEGHKMSKSRGNLVLVSRLRSDGVDPMAIRLVLLAQHYASSWEFHPGLLVEAQHRLERWRAAVSAPAGPDARELLGQVRAALMLDLDAPRALAAIDDWADAALDQDGEAGSADAPGEAARLIDALLGVAL